MKYERRILEVSLERVELGVTARRTVTRSSGQHLVAATMVYPRPMIAERTSLKTVSLPDGTADLRKAGWASKVLFKEVVQGPFAIRLDVSEELSNSEVGRFIGTLTETFAKLAKHESAEMAVGAWTAGLVKVPMEYLGKALSSTSKNAPCSMGTGEIDLAIDEGWKEGSSGKIRVPIGVERDVYRVNRTRRGGEMVTRRKKLLSAGDENGWVELSLRTYD